METRGHVAVHADHPGASTDMQPAGAGSLQTNRLLGILMHGKRRCCARRLQEEVFVDVSPRSVHGEGAHGTGHRRGLQIIEAQGHVPLRTDLQVGPPGIMEVGAMPPAETACGVDAEAAPPTPQVGGQNCVRPYTRSLAFRHRGTKEIGPQRSQMFRRLVLSPVQAYSLMGNVKASAGAGHEGRRRKCF